MMGISMRVHIIRTDTTWTHDEDIFFAWKTILASLATKKNREIIEVLLEKLKFKNLMFIKNINLPLSEPEENVELGR